MKEIAEYLDNIGHSLGLGGFEGLIGAGILVFAVIFMMVFSSFVLKSHRKAAKAAPSADEMLHQDGSAHLNEDRFKNPIDWMEDIDRTIGCDQKTKALDPSWDMLPDNIWHKNQ